jgi:AcrR family transcriptional regulator
MASQAERRSGTRRRILRAAARLFRAQGFEGTSVDQIVAAANLAKGSFYVYFPAKIDVALALTSEEQGRLMQKMRSKLASGQSPLAVGGELLRSMGTWFERNRGIARSLLLRALDQPRIESPDSTRTVLTLIFSEAQKRGEIRGDLPAEYISGLLVGSIVQIALHWTRKGRRGQLPEWFALAWKLHLEGALPR